MPAVGSSRSSSPSRRNVAAAPVRYGSTAPRIFTPPLRTLSRRTSLGYAVCDFAREVLHVELLEWQRWLLIHALELRPDGGLRFRTVLVLCARQNGKSLLSQILALWFMYVYGFALVIGTAQDLDVAEEIWQGAVDIVEETPELDALKERVILVNGKKTLELKTGQRYKVKAATRRAGRGLSGDLVLLDELREHQTWEAWAAITKTMMARAEAQSWALSNAGDATSVVLRYLRLMGHAALGNPDGLDMDGAAVPDEDAVLEDDESFGIFEWSAAPNRAVSDRAGWAQANPAMNVMISERTIASAMRTDPEWVFRTEVLCQWNSGSVEGPFPAGAWEKCLDAASSIRDAAELAVGVDVSADRSYTSIVLAGLNQHGVPHVEVAASRAGTEWVAGWLLERQATGRLVAVALQGKGAPVSPLAGELESAGLPVLRWEGADLAAGTGKFYDAVCSAGLRHVPQPPLDIAAATATTKPLGDNWVWNRRQSATDIAPLVAATAAWWALTCRPVKRVSAYESDAELIVA